MVRPFEGVFGNTCELRLLEFLLPLDGMKFNITELSEEAGVSRSRLAGWSRSLSNGKSSPPPMTRSPGTPLIRRLRSSGRSIP
ncbi:conserved protein of unknown function [Methanoculleus bourgensis]|uniref:Uncharacterized protein n=1 Tax=Methanoculleus bourgensis TaxID=83986 RepID=A0A0X8XZQ9_9EURY|nr:conserved protein of unknown function [Methanoculleus bourgensis]